MKKQIYLMVGLATFFLVLFVAAWIFYNKYQDATLPKPQVSDEAREKLSGQSSWSLGNSIARVTLVEFFDPECEACRTMHPIIKDILKKYEGRIYYTVRYMPLHQNSKQAALALEAAGAQGKFWEALDVLFEYQPEWGSHESPRPELIFTYLEKLGLDMNQLKKDMNRDVFQKKIDQDHADGVALGVKMTPTFFVNGSQVNLIDPSSVEKAVAEATN